MAETFQILTILRDTVNSCVPSGEKDTPFTRSPCGMRAVSCPVPTSQILAKPEVLPPTSHLPSGLNASTCGMPLRFKVAPDRSKDIPCAFHKTTVFSVLPVASHFPSWLKAAEMIFPTCVRSATGCRVWTSHILVLLCKPAASISPDGLNASEFTASELTRSNCFSPVLTSQKLMKPLIPAVMTNLLSLSNATPFNSPPC